MIGTCLAHRYALTAELGRGGMGIVYRGHDPHLDREVAIKVISAADLGPKAEKRFLREAQLVARMDHPSIVPIYDLGRHDDLLFFVMPVLRGHTLLEINEAGFLALGDTLEIIVQVAEALDYSHQQGVVHRDVKPENIMVSRDEDEGLDGDDTGDWPAAERIYSRLRARVMDFGLALDDATTRLTRTGKLPGTLGYLSPEQILATEVDGRSDIYSLATILYECLAGQPPFAGSRYALLYQIVHEKPPSLEKHGIEPELAELVLRCLAKNAEDRPQRGRDLASRLRRHLESLTQAGLQRAVSLHPVERRAGEEPVPAPLVGREEECAVLLGRLDLVATGQCQLVLVGGNPGMGKTRLLQEIEQSALGRGFQVLWGRFSDHESAFPFQGFGELIQDGLNRNAKGGRHSPLGGTKGGSEASKPDLQDLAAELQALFPALSDHPKLLLEDPSSGRSEGQDAADDPPRHLPAFAWSAARKGDPTHLYEVLARALTRLAEDEPTVFMLENLHSAEISIEALQYIVRRLAAMPVLFLATYRRPELSRRHPLNRMIESAGDEPRVTALVLGTLSTPEIHELAVAQLGGHISEELSTKLYEATEGNPFFARELIRSLLDATDVSQDPSGIWVLSGELALSPDALPETIQQAVESRLELLDDDLLGVLKIASVLGRSFRYQDLEALTGENVEEAVERLVRDDLLEEDHRHGLHLFSSGVVCDVLHSELSRRRRRVLHRRHAENLERRFATRLEQVYPQLVHHFAAGDVADKTIHYALALARKSLDAVGFNTAIRALKTALEFVEEEELDRATEGELRFLLGRALRAAGSNEAAVKEAARAFHLLREHHPSEAARAALFAAETAWQGRHVAETRRWVDAGIDLGRASGTHEILQKLLTLGATVANLSGEHQKARARWDEAQELLVVPAEEAVPCGGTLVTAMGAEVHELDPRHFRTPEESEVVGAIFETLIDSDAEGHLKPCLCEQWELASGARTLRVTLRRDVCFSDGTPLLAADVERSLLTPDRQRRPEAVAALRGVEILSENVLALHLNESLPIFPVLLSDPGTAIFRLDNDGRALGTGPFTLASSRPERLRLGRNPHYWRAPLPYLDSLVFRFRGDPADVATDLRAGDVDVGRDLPTEELDRLLRDARSNVGVVEVTRQAVYLVAVNPWTAAARRQEVRRVLLDVIRVPDLVWRVLGRRAQPASCLIPPGLLGHDPGRRRPQISHREARQILRQAGVEVPLELRAVVHPLFAARNPSFLRALADEWKAAGIEVKLLEDNSELLFEGREVARDLDLWIGPATSWYNDPDGLTLGLLHSRRGYLARYFKSETIDELTEQARRSAEIGRRRTLYQQLESHLVDERLVLPLFYDIDYRLIGPAVRGLRLSGGAPFVSYSEAAKRVETAAATPRESAVIHVPLQTFYGDLSPRQAHVQGHVEALGNIFETLTRLDEGARIVPCLASEFRLEEGGRRFRFKLRSNVRFHDGRQLTVRDVRYSFEELIRGLGEDAFVAELLPIHGGYEFWQEETSELAGFTILSANEFVIDLERPLSFFPAMLTSASASIIPEGTRHFGPSWKEGTAGTGPFRLVEFDGGTRLELEANPHYWRRGLPKCDRLVFDIDLDPAAIPAEFEAGELALAAHLRPTDVDMLLTGALASRYQEAPGFSTHFLILDSRRGPFSDRGRRQALHRLIENAAAARDALGRLATPACGLIPPGLLGYEPGDRRSSAEHSEVDTEPSLEGLVLRVVIIPAYRGPFAPFWDALIAAFERSGARLDVVVASPAEALWRIAQSEVDLVAARWVAGYPDPDALIHFFHTRGYLGGLVGKAEIDALFAEGRDENDPVLRHTIYRKIDQILGQHEALIPLFHEQVYRIAHPDLQGLRLRFGWPEVAYEELRL